MYVYGSALIISSKLIKVRVSYIPSSCSVFSEIKARSDRYEIPVSAQLTGRFQVDTLHTQNNFILVEIISAHSAWADMAKIYMEEDARNHVPVDNAPWVRSL